MVEPEIWEFLDGSNDVASSLGLVVLPEVHDTTRPTRGSPRTGYWTYDFVLRGCCCRPSRPVTATRLAAHLARSPARQFTTLGLSRRDPGQARPRRHPRARRDGASGATVIERGRQRQPDPVRGPRRRRRCPSAQLHVLLGLGGRTTRTSRRVPSSCSRPGSRRSTTSVSSRARTTTAALARTGEGRAVNRHDYTLAEIDEALARPVVREVLELLRIRATHAAFDGPLMVETPSRSSLRLTREAGTARSVLEVDMNTGAFTLAT